MAERRMFAKTIIDSDAFLDMPLTAQALYFHLAMRADDDGFINNTKRIQRTIGCGDDDVKILIAKNFIIPFESGVFVIKHWRIHNYIRSDRYKETTYREEKAMLTSKANKAYSLEAEMPARIEEKPAKESGDVAPTWKTATTEKEKRFCRFWDSYPRKVGKLKVWKLWDRMNYSEDLTGRMIEAVEKQRNSYEWKKNGGQYIPHPLTWLNRGGWDDEIGEEAGYGTGQVGRQQFRDRGIDYDAILRDFERSHGEGNDV